MAQRSATRGVREGVAVVGAGNWGSSLAAGLVAAGIPLVEVVVRDGRGRRRKVGGLSPVSWGNAAFDAEALWLCVQDGEIASVAEGIAARRGDLRGQTVVHSSGALTVEVLRAARAAGARVGGIAPVFSFPTPQPVALQGVMFAVEIGDGMPPHSEAALWRRLSRMARSLGGQPLRVSSRKKIFYHAAATMASPLLVSELQAAVATAGLAGLSSAEAKAVVQVLAAATLRNYFAAGAERSFSGAFARGDAGTVELHLRALEAHPILHGVYRELARFAVDSLPVRGGEALGRILNAVGPGRVRD